MMEGQNRRGSEGLRVGVIGVGAMGRIHARIYADMPDVRLVAVADPNEESLARQASLYHTHTYTNYARMLSEERLDAVSVAVPTRLHSEVAEQVIRRGIGLLIEKPLASTVEECEAIVQWAHQEGVCLGVGHVERFNPAIADLKRRLDSGVLGRVFQITIRRIGPFPSRIKDVGVLLDLATHDIDAMFYLTGSDIDRVSAESARMLHAEHEDLAVGMLRFSNGVIGVLIENWLSPVKVREVAVNGERGMFVADFLTQDLCFYENNYTESGWESLQVLRGVAEGNMIRYHLRRDEPLRLELSTFVNSVADNRPFPVSGEDGLRAVRVARLLAEVANRSHGVELIHGPVGASSTLGKDRLE